MNGRPGSARFGRNLSVSPSGGVKHASLVCLAEVVAQILDRAVLR